MPAGEDLGYSALPAAPRARLSDDGVAHAGSKSVLPMTTTEHDNVPDTEMEVAKAKAQVELEVVQTPPERTSLRLRPSRPGADCIRLVSESQYPALVKPIRPGPRQAQHHPHTACLLRKQQTGDGLRGLGILGIGHSASRGLPESKPAEENEPESWHTTALGPSDPACRGLRSPFHPHTTANRNIPSNTERQRRLEARIPIPIRVAWNLWSAEYETQIEMDGRQKRPLAGAGAKCRSPARYVLSISSRILDTARRNVGVDVDDWRFAVRGRDDEHEHKRRNGEWSRAWRKCAPFFVAEVGCGSGGRMRPQLKEVSRSNLRLMHGSLRQVLSKHHMHLATSVVAPSRVNILRVLVSSPNRTTRSCLRAPRVATHSPDASSSLRMTERPLAATRGLSRGPGCFTPLHAALVISSRGSAASTLLRWQFIRAPIGVASLQVDVMPSDAKPSTRISGEHSPIPESSRGHVVRAS
uniref:Uncharacterized protein n=1 Tax=Mycena chlorophos TaxID=658473 RepID=A0ABQ0L048_MYCCL|nr:predicted protein [Mycena chlorophos]